jgi:hypothetical protein
MRELTLASMATICHKSNTLKYNHQLLALIKIEAASEKSASLLGGDEYS